MRWSLSLAAILVVPTFSALATSPPSASASSPAEPASTQQWKGFYCDRTGLTDQQRERKRELSTILRTSLIDIREIERGFEFEYPNDLSTYSAAAEFIPLERLCCPFFEFGLRLEPEGGRLRVSLTGPEGVKPESVKSFIREEFRALFER